MDTDKFVREWKAAKSDAKEAMSINAITPIEEFWPFMEAVRSHSYMIKLLSIVPAVLSGETIGPPVEAAMARFLVLDARYQASCTSPLY